MVSVQDFENPFEVEQAPEDQIAAEVLVIMAAARPAVQEKKKSPKKQLYANTRMTMKPLILQKLMEEPFIRIPFWNPNPSEYYLESDREPTRGTLIPSMDLYRKYEITGHTHGYPIGRYISSGSVRYYRMSVFVGLCPLVNRYMIGVLCGNMRFFKNDLVHSNTHLKNKEIIFFCNFGTRADLEPRFDAFTCAWKFRTVLLDGFENAGLRVTIENRHVYIQKEDLDAYKRIAHKLILRGMRQAGKKMIVEIPHVNIRSD